MPPRILIADPDQAFGQMLKQMLELNGDYHAEHVSTGALALAAVRKHTPDLAIIDMAIRDVPPPLLISSIQQWAPQARVMLIPVGETLPDEFRSLHVQGVLNKPFFIGDLGRQIARALGTQTKPLVHLPPPLEQTHSPSNPRVRQIVQAPPRAPGEPESSGNGIKAHKVDRAAPELHSGERPIDSPPASARFPVPPGQDATANSEAPTARPRARPLGQTARTPLKQSPPRDRDRMLDDVLLSLAGEIHADAVFVMSNGALVAQHSEFDSNRLKNLMERVLLWRKAADDLATLLGERGRLQRSQLEGERYSLYSYNINESLCLLVLCRSDLPLGTVRLAIRSAAEQMGKIVH